MAAVTTGSKTVTTDLSPYLTAATLTTILATAVENLTLTQLHQLKNAINRTPLGSVPTNTIGQVLI